MRGTFGDGLDHLSEKVGTGHLVGGVEVNQVYAGYQEFNDWLNHPEGGEAHALENSLYRRNEQHMQHLAEGAITEDGSRIENTMAENMEDLSEQYYVHAPWEFGDLRASGHPTVTSDGHTVYDRPPNQPRLTEEELRDKSHLRSLGLGHGDF